MHYFAAVVVRPPDRNTVEVMPVAWDEKYFQANITLTMRPWDENLDVKPYRQDYETYDDKTAEEAYKDALAWDAEERCREHFEGDKEDMKAVLKWYTGLDLEQDEEGWYYMSTANPDGEWDWWQIGGRWSGVWTGYEPTEDPANKETCWLCHGTGLRDDEGARKLRETNPDYMCNGCDGTKEMVKFQSHWARHEGDAVTVDAFLESLAAFGPEGDGEPEFRTPHTLIAPGLWLERETFRGGEFHQDENWNENLAEALEPYRGGVLVVVDYHS